MPSAILGKMALVATTKDLWCYCYDFRDFWRCRSYFRNWEGKRMSMIEFKDDQVFNLRISDVIGVISGVEWKGRSMIEFYDDQVSISGISEDFKTWKLITFHFLLKHLLCFLIFLKYRAKLNSILALPIPTSTPEIEPKSTLNYIKELQPPEINHKYFWIPEIETKSSLKSILNLDLPFPLKKNSCVF